METKASGYSVDDHITYLAYYCVKIALFIMEIIDNTNKGFLSGDGLTPQQKHELKKEHGFSSTAVMCLGQAEKSFKAMVRALDIVEQQMDDRADIRNFDKAQAMVYEIMCLDLVYSELTAQGHNEVNRKKIHDYLKKYNWNLEGLDSLYDSIAKKRDSLVADYKRKEAAQQK